MTDDNAIHLRGKPMENPEHGNAAHRTSLYDAAKTVHQRAAEQIAAAMPATTTTMRDIELNNARRVISEALDAQRATILRAGSDAVTTADNRDLFPAGRADRIGELVAGADEIMADSRNTVTNAAAALRNALEQAALPDPPTGDTLTATLTEIRTLLDATPVDQRGAIYDRLAARADGAAGWLLSENGLELAIALFGEKAGSARHRGARLRHLQARYEAGDRAAVASRAVYELEVASNAYRSAWKSVRTNIGLLASDLNRKASAAE